MTDHTSAKSHLTSGELLRVWWAFIWRNSLLGFVAGAILGTLAGFILNIFGYGQFGTIVGAILGMLANAIIGYFVLRYVLAKRFKGFALVVQREQPSELKLTSDVPAPY